MADPIHHRATGHHLAQLSGVDVATATPKKLHLWEARGLALHALARGDMAEAEKIMAAAKGGAA